MAEGPEEPAAHPLTHVGGFGVLGGVVRLSILAGVDPVTVGFESAGRLDHCADWSSPRR